MRQRGSWRSGESRCVPQGGLLGLWCFYVKQRRGPPWPKATHLSSHRVKPIRHINKQSHCLLQAATNFGHIFLAVFCSLLRGKFVLTSFAIPVWFWLFREKREILENLLEDFQDLHVHRKLTFLGGIGFLCFFFCETFVNICL